MPRYPIPPYTQVPIDSLFNLADSAPTPEALAVTQDSRERLLDVLVGLLSPQAYRVMVSLYFDGLTTIETATLFSLSESRVKAIRRQALAVLRGSSDVTDLLSQ